MKKLISSILVLIIFITSFAISFANVSLNKISLRENGIGRNFEVLNLKVDGQTIKSEDVPPVMYVLNNQGRTLVPLRMIIENLGDKLNADIEWNQERYEVKVKTINKEIILKIDSPIALVNGVQKQLPDNVPAKLLAIGTNGRTMVPIRFFAEELGLNVGWDNNTRTAIIDVPKAPETKPEKDPIVNPQPPIGTTIDITDVKVEMNGSMPQIRIKASGQVDYKEFKLVNPDRLVIDFNNAKFSLNKSRLEANGTLNIQTNSDLIKNVRLSQFQKDPFITRVVMELGKSTEYKITYDDKNGEFVIDFVNYIRDVKKEIINTKEVIVIEGDSVEDYNIIQLSNPERLVVDIKGGVLHSSLKTTINADGKVAKAIRVSQFATKSNEPSKSGLSNEDNELNENIVRVVIDLQEDSNYEEAYAEVKDGKLNIHLEGEPFKAIQYEETGWTTSRLTLLGSTVTRYSISRQLAPNLIEVIVPKNDIELELASLNIDDHIIKSIDISEDAHKDNYTIKLELQDSVDYTLVSSERSKDLVLELNNKNAKYREMLIVIDPGHGGSDPGAIPISKNPSLYESVIVLDIATRYNKLLTEAGFRTYMTRVDNLTPNRKLELKDRVDVANHLNANMFVSVHANAFTNNSINGFETYYYPSDIEGKKIAQVFQNEIIKNVPINSRGVKPGDLYVLRNTAMPSVLVETGYLSNVSDEARLATTQYRQQVAEAMFKATVRYFEEVR